MRPQRTLARLVALTLTSIFLLVPSSLGASPTFAQGEVTIVGTVTQTIDGGAGYILDGNICVNVCPSRRVLLFVPIRPGDRVEVCGEDVSYRAMPPPPCSRIVSVCASNHYIINIHKIDGTPATTRYTLRVTASGCGDTYPREQTYDAGERANIEASPCSGWKFDHWGGDASGYNSSTSVYMNSNKNVTAYFVQVSKPKYSLSTYVSPSGGGSVSPSGGTYNDGEHVTLTTRANAGWTFDRWGGDTSGTSTSTTITMNSNKSVTAYFEEKPKEKMYTLTIEITGRGTTTPSPGSRIYRAGSKKMVSVAPDDGWKFDHWGGDVRSTEKNVSITMSADRRIIAHFIERPKEEIKKSTLAEKNERAAAVKIWVAAQKCVVDEKSKDDYLEELLEEYFEELAKSTYEYCTDPILSYYFGLPNKVKDDIYDLWKFSKNAQSKYYENIEYDRLRKCEFPRLLDEFSNLVQEETECWAKDDLKCASNKMIEEGRKLQYMRGVLKAARYDEFQDRFNPIGNMLFEEWRYLWKEYYKINQNEEPNYMGDSFFRRTWIIEKGEQDAKKILGEKY